MTGSATGPRLSIGRRMRLTAAALGDTVSHMRSPWRVAAASISVIALLLAACGEPGQQPAGSPTPPSMEPAYAVVATTTQVGAAAAKWLPGGAGAAIVRRAGFGKAALFVDRDEGVQPRVERPDALEEEPRQLDARDLACCEGGREFRERRVEQAIRSREARGTSPAPPPAQRPEIRRGDRAR